MSVRFFSFLLCFGMAQASAFAGPCAKLSTGRSIPKTVVVYSKAKKMICYFRDGKLRFSARATYGTTEGKKRFQGDKKTPEGRYALAPARRSKKFGLFMHISYPSAADRAYAKRRKRLPGSAVGVHGPPRAFTFLGAITTWFNATDGCILLKEADMLRFARTMKRRTPMVILSR